MDKFVELFTGNKNEVNITLMISDYVGFELDKCKKCKDVSFCQNPRCCCECERYIFSCRKCRIEERQCIDCGRYICRSKNCSIKIPGQCWGRVCINCPLDGYTRNSMSAYDKRCAVKNRDKYITL